MTTTYTGSKGRVRRVTVPPMLGGDGSRYCWLGSVPGGVYLVRDGLHFDDWAGAIEYVTRKVKEQRHE